MRELFLKLMNEYLKARSNNDKTINELTKKTIPLAIEKTGVIDLNEMIISGSQGRPRIPIIAWVAIMNKNITDTPNEGVYITYLLSKDTNKLFLTLNQGCKSIEKRLKGKGEAVEELVKNAEYIRKNLNYSDAFIGGTPDLGQIKSGSGKHYREGTIIYKEYQKDFMPDEIQLIEDLKEMNSIYNEYYEKVFKKNDGILKDTETKIEETSGKEIIDTTKSVLDSINHYIKSKGFQYTEGLIENFYLSLKSKPFVILAGVSGTGKTKLVELFAEAINAEYQMIPVRPDWSDSSDLFGHIDLNGEFIPGKLLDYIAAAKTNPNKPYILCLDEMNLARVEYYLSEFLSVIETRKTEGDKIVSEPLISERDYGKDSDKKKEYGTIGFPENLYIVGTVNMDETTFPFSKKVLDRANTIEFDDVNLISDPPEHTEETESLKRISNDFLKTEYLLLRDCEDSWNLVTEVCEELQKINDILREANAHVGYRVRDEIVFYMLNNKKTGLLKGNEPMDLEILQKILPRIQGSSYTVKKMLCKLFPYLIGNPEGSTDTSDKMYEELNNSDSIKRIKYPRSAAKVAFMVRRFEEDGFTSYWL